MNPNYIAQLFPSNSIGWDLGTLNGDFAINMIALAKPKFIRICNSWLADNGLYNPNRLNRLSQWDMDQLYKQTIYRFKNYPCAEITRASTERFLNSCKKTKVDWIHLSNSGELEFFPIEVNKAWGAIKPGGHLIFSNQGDNNEWSIICNKVNFFLQKLTDVINIDQEYNSIILKKRIAKKIKEKKQ